MKNMQICLINTKWPTIKNFPDKRGHQMDYLSRDSQHTTQTKIIPQVRHYHIKQMGTICDF